MEGVRVNFLLHGKIMHSLKAPISAAYNLLVRHVHHKSSCLRSFYHRRLRKLILMQEKHKCLFECHFFTCEVVMLNVFTTTPQHRAGTQQTLSTDVL